MTTTGRPAPDTVTERAAWARDVIRDHALPLGARLLAVWLIDRHETGQVLSWRRADAAAELGVSTRTVQRWFVALRRREWLQVERQPAANVVPTYTRRRPA